MKKMFLQVLIVAFLTLLISAQDSQLKLFDSAGQEPLEFLRMRIDSIGREVVKTSDSKLLVRIYGGDNKTFARPYNYGSSIKSIWKNFLKHPPEKLEIQFCNINNEPFLMKYYLVQANANIETCEENLKIPQKTVLFESSYFDGNIFSTSIIDFNSVENEYPATEYTIGSYSEFALNILKKFLKDSPESKVYIIGYLDTNFETDDNGKVIAKNLRNLDKKSRLNKMFQATHKELLKNGFSNSQIKMIDGGYVNFSRKLEFWFVPKGGVIPKPKPDYLPQRKNHQKR